ncbi:hypothetical protein C4J85_2909 [Pseudomonas sp. R4-34-07]|uniref:hypothetical protein n=1 Tax=Pseudomonas sp. R4-34-07 TaxID=658642 RepID=UPI000F6D2CF7|nr:hypothetical protein [Pseudomonas sp. R4-34-07]AZF53393.1 hypothetical protein C4J85_2909 [Pseudomonas sp. R4-34-07]
MAVVYSHKFRPSDADVGEPEGGDLGKLIYTTIAITGFVVSVRSQNIFFGPTAAGLTLHVSLAMAGARHIFMVTYWQRVKVWLCRTLSCELAHDGVERRTK